MRRWELPQLEIQQRSRQGQLGFSGYAFFSKLYFHHQGCFDGVAVIALPASRLQKTMILIERDSSGVRFTNFEEHSSYAALAKFGDGRSQQGSAFALAPSR